MDIPQLLLIIGASITAGSLLADAAIHSSLPTLDQAGADESDATAVRTNVDHCTRPDSARDQG